MLSLSVFIFSFIIYIEILHVREMIIIKNKIIYFDRESINNILQVENNGDHKNETTKEKSVSIGGEVEIEAKIKIAVPFLDRLSFLFSSKISTSVLVRKSNVTTITSTEISEFSKKIKDDLIKFLNYKVSDIENSSTYFRVAGTYLKMLKNGVDEVDVEEFNKALISFDGYDTYRISENEYVRFNTQSFLSNYKRNDLLLSKLDLYCISIGFFNKSDFDFFKQIKKMETLFVELDTPTKLSDVYPPNNKIQNKNNQNDDKITDLIQNIKLYDVVYAEISEAKSDE